jgi:hypothetical protein
VPITTTVVILNPAHCEVYSIQQYVIEFDSDLWQVGGFLRVGFSTNKIDRNDITEILLKVVLNNITVTTVWSTGAKHVENYKIYSKCFNVILY